MYAYRIVLLVAGAMLVLGVGYAAFSSDEMTPERAVATGEAIRMEADRDAAISRWAAERGWEFVPAPRGDEPVRRVNAVTGREATPEEIAEANREPSEFEVQPGQAGRAVTIVAEPDGGAPEVIYQNRPSRVVSENHGHTRRRIRITSIADLLKLNVNSRDDMQRLEKGDVDVDLFRLRDDVNRGLIGLGTKIRTLDQTYSVPGVGGASSYSGEMSWAPGAPVHEGSGSRAARRPGARID